MKKPRMICFDYGETLVHEEKFNGEKGYAKILEYAEENPYHRTAKELADIASEMNDALGRFDMDRKHLIQTEIPDIAFQAYLMKSQKIKLRMSYEKIATEFWDAAAYGRATEGIEEFLAFIRNEQIKTGVISNISFSGDILEKRLRKLIPSHKFDFIIASSDYVFRKPNKKIFELALVMADVMAEETWHCGDQYLCDIQGAIKVGIHPVWYTKKDKCVKEWEKGIIRISSWQELKEIIGEVCYD